MSQAPDLTAAQLSTESTSFDTVDDLIEGLDGQGYLVDDDLAVVVHLATLLDRPLLLEGPAGVGKTELAKSLAAAAGRELIRLQCYCLLYTSDAADE